MKYIHHLGWVGEFVSNSGVVSFPESFSSMRACVCVCMCVCERERDRL